MKGYFSIIIPTKPYIKAYLKSRLGEPIIMDRSNHIGRKFYDLLEKKSNEERLKFSPNSYKCDVKVYVSYRVFRERGCNMHESNIKGFNAYLEDVVKERFYFMMDIYISLFPNFEANLPLVRANLGIEEEDWSFDSMKKDYYRYRKNSGKPLLYKKKYPAFVPSVKSIHAGL